MEQYTEKAFEELQIKDDLKTDVYRLPDWSLEMIR